MLGISQQSFGAASAFCGIEIPRQTPHEKGTAPHQLTSANVATQEKIDEQIKLKGSAEVTETRHGYNASTVGGDH